MTYFEGFVVPVPDAQKAAYAAHAQRFAPIVREFGADRIVECWESDVPEGGVTDFRKAVATEPGEKVVLSWIEYSSRQQRDSANEKFMNDPRMQDLGEMPFDGKRMIMGGFDSVIDDGIGGGRYVDGWIVPVPEDKRDDYFTVARKMLPMFREQGATRVVEAWGDDVMRGKVTDFFRAVRAGPAENVVFSVIEWPNRETRDQAWEKMRNDDRMRPDRTSMPFDGKRMFWGGFDKILDTQALHAEVEITIPTGA